MEFTSVNKFIQEELGSPGDLKLSWRDPAFQGCRQAC